MIYSLVICSRTNLGHADGKLIFAVVFAAADFTGRVVGLEYQVRQGLPVQAGRPHAYLLAVIGSLTGNHLLLRVVVFVTGKRVEGGAFGGACDTLQVQA